IHGRAKKIGETLYLPLFHPAAALHQPRYRSAIEQDFLKIPDLLKQAVPAEEDHPGEQAEQLNLF
nr:uracil-DNA glycosylase [Anaerolineae bacterium]